MAQHTRVQSRLLRVFVLQLALISLVTVAGVFVASLVAERLLVRQALLGEAAYFWENRDRTPQFALPNTLNLQSYLIPGSDDLPEALRHLPLGQHRVDLSDGDKLVYVSERGDERLFLLFEDDTVSDLAFYFGVVPLTLVLLFMYCLAYLAYVLSKRAVSPIARLADRIESFDFTARDAAELDLSDLRRAPNSETMVLADALEHFVERSQASIDRERDFTRYASHELRTPLAIIQGSVSSIELAELDGAPARALQRIKRASASMGDMITSLLALARVHLNDDSLKGETALQPLVDSLVRELHDVEDDKPVQVLVEHEHALVVLVGEAPLSIVIGNILRNAYRYTDNGTVSVTVGERSITVSDTGSGLSADDQLRVFEPFYRADNQAESVRGQGLGLAIVKQTCDHHGWVLSLDSTLGQGTTVRVAFPASGIKPLAA